MSFTFPYKLNLEMAEMIEKFKACMVLHAVGDAMGYKNGSWEFKVNIKSSQSR